MTRLPVETTHAPIAEQLPARPAFTLRAGPAAGIGAAMLTLYAILGPPWPPDPDAPADVWQAQLADAGNRIGLLAAAFAATIAGVLFVVFLTGLRQRGVLARDDSLAVLGYGCGLLFVMSLIAAFCAWVAVPAGVQISGEPIPSGDVIRFLNDLGQAFLAIPAPLCGGVFVLALGIDARRTAAIPRWLATGGCVVGIVQLCGILFFPLLLIPVWIGIVGVVLLLQPSIQQGGTMGKAESVR